MSQKTEEALSESHITLSDKQSRALPEHTLPLLNCTSCDYSSTNKHYLRQHVDLVHATERPFKCPFCDYAGKRSHSLKEHLIVHSDERPYKCAHCNAKFRKKGHLTNHYRMHSEAQNAPKCTLCTTGAVEFKTHDDLYKHLRHTHAELRDKSVFWCNRCSYATLVRGNLHIHEMAHTDYRHIVLMKPKLPPSASIILKCSDCGFETSQRKELEAHVVQRHFDGDDKVVVKPVNRQQQSSDKTNQPHVVETPSQVPKYKCTKCGYVTSDHKQLVVHAMSHTTSVSEARAPPKSNPVLMKLSTPSNSVVTPTSEGSYVCSICTYFCDTQRTLKAHMWKHLGHKNLEYPTFQNGPLSVYDDTPLAAKNFVKRPPIVQQPIKVSQLATDNNRPVVGNSEVTNNNDLQVNNQIPANSNNSGPKSAALQSCSPVKKVLVEKIQQVPDSRTTSDNPDAHHEPHAPATYDYLKMASTDKPAGESADGSPASKRSCSPAEESKIDSSLYSATEQTAATLLSLLRQGPNINPACPPAGYFCEVRDESELAPTEDAEGSDSAVVGDVAGEEVVGMDGGDNVSCDSGQVSDSLSAGKPKQGICSSLLAVIEQLRERQVQESPQTSLSKARRKRKREPTKAKKQEMEVDEASDGLVPEVQSPAEADETLYRCKSCPYHTSSAKEMQQHISLHMEQSSDVDVLPSDFTSVLDVDQPLSTAENTIYRCKLCHYRSSAHFMRQHMKVHKTKKPHECSLCDFVATSTSALQDHMIQHCKTRQFQCKQCSTVFNYKSQLRAHTRVHEDGQAFYCDQCEYVTSYIDSFQEHLNLHSETITSFTCIACRQVFSHLIELQTHMKDSCEEVKKLHKANPLLNSASAANSKAADSGLRTLKCDQCEFVALSIRSLKSHLKRHINDKRYIQQPLEQYKCNICGYVCHHMPSLKSHMWRHANDSQFSYSFTDLMADTAVDKKGKPLFTLRCCQCGFETLNKLELDKHMKSHWDIIRKTFDVGSTSTSPSE